MPPTTPPTIGPTDSFFCGSGREEADAELDGWDVGVWVTVCTATSSDDVAEDFDADVASVEGLDRSESLVEDEAASDDDSDAGSETEEAVDEVAAEVVAELVAEVVAEVVDEGLAEELAGARDKVDGEADDAAETAESESSFVLM